MYFVQWDTTVKSCKVVFLKKNDIKKLQKNISSDLLVSFGWQLITEDISVTDMQSISNN